MTESLTRQLAIVMRLVLFHLLTKHELVQGLYCLKCQSSRLFGLLSPNTYQCTSALVGG